MWNYMGWDNLSTIADEVDRPQTTYPLAMFGSVTLVIASYLLPVMAVAAARLDPGIVDDGELGGRGAGARRFGFGAGDCRRRDDRRFGDFRELDAFVYEAAGGDGRRRISAASICAPSAEDRCAVGGDSGVRGGLGGLLAARLFSVADSRCAADRIEHSAGIRRSHRFADSGTESGAALPDSGRNFGHDSDHRTADRTARSQSRAEPQRASGRNK